MFCSGQKWRVLLAFTLAFLMVGKIWAQEIQKPALKAIRLDGKTVQLDGRLEEAFWHLEGGARAFVQQEPHVGEAAQATSLVRVAFDEAALYIGAQLDDPQPDHIRADERREDADFERSDTFAVLIDTYHDHQSAFFFESTPLSAVADALVIQEGEAVNRDWDGNWQVAAKRTDRGWSIEFRIPFSSLRFRPGPDQRWGIQFRRRVPHLKEISFWSPLSAEQNFFEVSRAGHLKGLEVAKPIRPLSLKPYAKGTDQNDRVGTRKSSRADLEAGLDLRYRFRSNLTLDLTYNTDFAETEVDRFQVNLTRFPLFFPEKREFFLEGKGFYDFGLSGRVQPFFSRQIGLIQGASVPILLGGKLSGKAGPYGIGTLVIQTEAQGESPAETFGLMRLSRDFGLRSKVGLIATERKGRGEAGSETFGLDAALSPNTKFTTKGFWVRSEGEGDDEVGEAAFVEAQWRDPFWRLRLSHLRIDPDFSPASGFVRQPDLHETFGFVDIRPQPKQGGIVREYGFKTEMTYQSDASGQFLYQSNYNRMQADFRSGDFLLLSVDPQRERLPEDFKIRPGIVIPAGTYRYTHYNVIFFSDNRRPLSGTASYLWGGFLGGRKASLDFNLTVAPREGVKIGTGWAINRIRLPQGDFSTQILSGDIAWSLSNTLLLQGLMQWDKEAEASAANFRLSWAYREGSWFYLIFNPTLQEEGDTYVVLTKLTWLWEP